MFKRSFIWILIFIPIFFTVNPVECAESEKKNIHQMAILGIGVRAALSGIESSYYLDDINLEFDETMQFGLNLIYYFNQYYGIEISTDYLTTDVELKFDNKSGPLGELKQIPILMTARFQFPINKTQTFIYIGGGGGYFLNDLDQVISSGTHEFAGLNAVTEIDDSYGFHLNAGVDYFITNSWALNLDFKCIFNKADIISTFPDGETREEQIALNTSVFALGIKFCF